jgi:hypothetical protein
MKVAVVGAGMIGGSAAHAVVRLAGSPLSYWAGIHGKVPMRYLGGLLGGTWLTALAGDAGDGIFDGANLRTGAMRNHHERAHRIGIRMSRIASRMAVRGDCP